MHHQPSEFRPLAPADSGAVLRHVEIRRAAACRSFWSDDALNRTYRQINGETFSLRDFTAFVIAMPPEQFLALAFQTAGGCNVR
jgi:hypothetical protein